jgi:hypothetical protein
MKMTTPKEAIKLKCIDCIYDEYVSGGKVQQVACCTAWDCDLFWHRPVPRECKKDGQIDQMACNQLRHELDVRDRRSDRAENVL